MNKANILRVANRLWNLQHEKHYMQHVIISKEPCGTAACVAGWAVLLDPRYRIHLNPDYSVLCSHQKDNIRTSTVRAYAEGRLDPQRERELDSKILDVLLEARKILGLTSDQAHTLFSAYPESAWPEPYKTQWRLAHAVPPNPQPLGWKPYPDPPSKIAARLLFDIAAGRAKLT